jgi:[ribosomal protein S5]-alanine N-acetyltransferase
MARSGGAVEQMRTQIETARLVLRPFQPSDVEAAFTWFGDPVVMQFTVTGPDPSIEDTRRRLVYFADHQQAHGFSKWVILQAGSGKAIGDSGLLVLQEYGWIDLGFRLAQPYWGQGLATEAASAWVRVAFDELHLERLGAFVHPKNAASIRVLEKLGFRVVRRDTVMGMDSLVFSLNAKSCNPAGNFTE